MQFEIRAYQNNGDTTQLVVEAESESAAKQQAKLKGLVPLSIKPIEANKPLSKTKKGHFELTLFSHELLLLLKAGLSLLDSIETLSEKESNTTTKVVLDNLKQALYEGLPLSAALARDPVNFDDLYVAMVKSSEKTGDLPASLGRYIDYQVQVNLVRKKIVSASIYPSLLLIVGGAVIGFLLLYVVPKFSAIYEGKGDDLPILSRWLLEWGAMMSDYTVEAMSGAVGFVILVAFLLSRPFVRRLLFSRLLGLRFLADKFKLYQLARFYRTAGMLLKGGIPIMSMFEMVSDLLKFDLSKQLAMASQDIQDGMPMSVAMEKHQLTTPVAVRMMRVGEKSGQMGQMLENIGDFYDDEIARWVDWFTKLFEPILMTLIGIVVGLVVVLMYMPIFDLAGSIQ